MAGSTEALLDTASMYLACFQAFQSESMRFTSDLETSSRTALITTDESERTRTVESVAA